MLYSQADSKKKSNLMMSLFDPGPEPLPWLGKISHLGPISGNLSLYLMSLQSRLKQANRKFSTYLQQTSMDLLSIQFFIS